VEHAVCGKDSGNLDNRVAVARDDRDHAGQPGIRRGLGTRHEVIVRRTVHG
jgi:hypothetical protein